jgi:hypothetical protein
VAWAVDAVGQVSTDSMRCLSIALVDNGFALSA